MKRPRKSRAGKIPKALPPLESGSEMLDDSSDQKTVVIDQSSNSPVASTEQPSSSISFTNIDATSSKLEFSESEQMLDVADLDTTAEDIGFGANTEMDAALSTLEFSQEHSTIRPGSRKAGLTESVSKANNDSIRSTKHSKKKRAAEQQPARPTCIDLGASTKLLDAMFRQLICGNKIRLGTGVKQNPILQTPALSEISPVLFSPGYLSVSMENKAI